MKSKETPKTENTIQTLHTEKQTKDKTKKQNELN
jgi:hypothetical protein